jgi:hypothetical protein
MMEVIKILVQTNMKFLFYISKITKNSLYIMAIILVMDFLHLQNQIAKKSYKSIYGKKYIPIHTRLMNTIQSSSQIALRK